MLLPTTIPPLLLLLPLLLPLLLLPLLPLLLLLLLPLLGAPATTTTLASRTSDILNHSSPRRT